MFINLPRFVSNSDLLALQLSVHNDIQLPLGKNHILALFRRKTNMATCLSARQYVRARRAVQTHPQLQIGAAFISLERGICAAFI